MGFFSDAWKEVKRAGQGAIDIARGEGNSEDWKRLGGALTGGAIAGVPGAGIGSAYMSEPPEPTMQSEDARIKALRERAYKDYQDFSSNLPGYKQAQMRPEVMQANMAEEQGLQNVRRGASRRGLLNSGIRQKGEADVKTEKANTLAEARANINRQANELADLKSDIATGIGITDTGAMQAAAMRAQDTAREEAARRRAMYSQIGSGLGYLAGSQYSPSSGTGSVAMNYNPGAYSNFA